MFYRLASRNSSRNRRENGLFFSSMLISIAAFYIILSLPNQDVVVFLSEMESEAVDRLMTMIPVFYGVMLFILSFIIFYAGSFWLQSRRHEFGVYLMLGMRRSRLFALLIAEDLFSSVYTLAVGLPAAAVLSELISLITARLAGIGIAGHHSSVSMQAAVWTTAGFFLIKFAAFLILSSKICREEIASLLVDTPESTKKQFPLPAYVFAMLIGILQLGAAYSLAITGISWKSFSFMAATVVLGLCGTMLLFYGLRFPVRIAAKRASKKDRLHIFTFRQIEETVIHRSAGLGISSLLILASLCCFGAGVAIVNSYGASDNSVLDYTFETEDDNAGEIYRTLAEHNLDSSFSDLFEIRLGRVNTSENYSNAFAAESVSAALSQLPYSEARRSLENRLSDSSYPRLISLSGYNQLLAASGKPQLALASGEAAVYMNREFLSYDSEQLFNGILETRPQVRLDSDEFFLTRPVQTVNIVTDRSITLSFALILPDDEFLYYTQGDYSTYVNGILKKDSDGRTSLIAAMSDMNQKLDSTGLLYESYLQNMGRRLFYMVAAGYVTVYLAIVFMIIANTVIGVQFLMGQRKSSARYKTLARLGAAYDVLSGSAARQINLYFGIPAAVAALSSMFGIKSLFTGILSPDSQGSIYSMLWVSSAVIFVLCVVEYVYISVVKRLSNRYIMALMQPEWQE